MSRQNSFYFAFLFLSFITSGCTSKSNTEKAEGTVSVQIPVEDGNSNYKLKTVDLLGIENLREVGGKFVRFFYAPGSVDGSLTGQAPIANFIKSGSTFIPADYVSTQMATIYYHMQNMAKLDEKVGAGGVNVWPRAVGMETQVMEGDHFKRNNAFYDGASDAMMFVPFTNQDLPISVNAGIIAHEHFHSLFYKLVLKSAVKNKKVITDSASIHDDDSQVEFKPLKNKMVRPGEQSSDDVLLFNEAYLRGINEGIADFWGWAYTEDVDFMKWSLPGYVADRSLTLDSAQLGHYETTADITSRISMFTQSDDVHGAIMSYSYLIGTPHARFLKTLAQITATDSKISIAEAKWKVATDVIKYLQQLRSDISALKVDQSVSASSLFQYIADQKIASKTMTDSSCQFLLSYLNYDAQNKTTLKCDHKENDVILAEAK